MRDETEVYMDALEDGFIPDPRVRKYEHRPGQLSPPSTEPHDFHAVHLPTSEASGINGPVVRITPMPKRMNLKNKLYQRSVVEHIGATDWNVGNSSPLVVELDPTAACDLACVTFLHVHAPR